MAVERRECAFIDDIRRYHHCSRVVQFRFDDRGDSVVFHEDDIPVNTDVHDVVVGKLPVHIMAR